MEIAPNPDSPSSEGFTTSPNASASSSSSTAAVSNPSSSSPSGPSPSRYESQKRRDWNTFGQYLKNHRPPLSLSRCSGAHVLEFLRYLDQFGKTKVHTQMCPFFGHPNPPAPCPCPLRQAWGSLDALIGRLRAAYEENGGRPESNPFGARAVRMYLREVRESQAKARGIPYEKKKRKRLPPPAAGESSSAAAGGGGAERSSGGGGESSASTAAATTVTASGSSGGGGSSSGAGEGSGTPPLAPGDPASTSRV